VQKANSLQIIEISSFIHCKNIFRSYFYDYIKIDLLLVHFSIFTIKNRATFSSNSIQKQNYKLKFISSKQDK